MRSIARVQWSMTVLCLAACAEMAGGDGSGMVPFDVTAAVPAVALDEAAEPVWTFGGLKGNPDDELRNVSGVVPLPGGRVLLTEAERLRLLDGDGVERWRGGRAGAGPNEFRDLSAPCHFHGDTVVAIDRGNHRFAFIVAGQGVVATEPAEGDDLRDGACSGEGEFLVSRSVADSATGGRALELRLRGAPGSVARRIASLAVPVTGTVGAGSPAFGFVDTLVYLADGNTGTIRLLRRDGGTVRTLTWAAPRVPVTDDNIPERMRAPRDAPPEALEAWRAEMRARPRTAHWPAFSDVASAQYGRLWLWPTMVPGADSIATVVLSTDGTLLGRVTIPRPTPDHQRFVLGLLPEGVAFCHTGADGGDRLTLVRYPAMMRR